MAATESPYQTAEASNSEQTVSQNQMPTHSIHTEMSHEAVLDPLVRCATVKHDFDIHA